MKASQCKSAKPDIVGVNAETSSNWKNSGNPNILLTAARGHLALNHPKPTESATESLPAWPAWPCHSMRPGGFLRSCASKVRLVKHWRKRPWGTRRCWTEADSRRCFWSCAFFVKFTRKSCFSTLFWDLCDVVMLYMINGMIHWVSRGIKQLSISQSLRFHIWPGWKHGCRRDHLRGRQLVGWEIELR